ncbi:hypothetical protein B0J12DRAFT_704315 [Macrophomina phaseolina]|uniref:Uncharacterized protein n=1 Tax=Macrophomina phaseolina TaxID=35725 RepID=A0ABQ8FW01_9PEZI|nr:hypothetical protein B0J12DRAFT_704315 [Macrophomina phaseolina]
MPDHILQKMERDDEMRSRSSRPKSLYEQFQEIERESSSQNEDPSQNGNDHDRPKRGGRGRPAKVQKQLPSPRKRRARPRRSLADVDEEVMSRPQTPSGADADEDANPDNAERSGEPSEAADQDPYQDDQDSQSANDPEESPSQQLINETTGAFRSNNTSRSNQFSPPREPRPKPTYVDEELEDDDLPPPFTNTPGTPSESEVDDDANRILRKRFDYMTNPQRFIAALTKYAPSERTFDVLYTLAENTQAALKAWQDEYLAIDKRVAVHANNGPRKPVNGGRVPVDPQVFDDQKEADIYSYVYDARKPPGTQDPFGQRIGTDYVGGRELRHRRTRDVTAEDLAQSEEEVGKRKRRAAQRFDGTADTGSRTRKRDHDGSETPEPPGPRKRGKVGSASKGQAYVPARIREMRGESAMTTSASEDDDTYEGTPEPRGPGRRRGRPPGSKNLAQRKDAGIKKGPRGKKGAAAQAAANAANNEQNSTQTTFPSAPSSVTGAPPQQPQQQQPFFVQGYNHAPHSNIPPASAAPVPGINADPTFISAHPQQTAQHPFSAGVPIQTTMAPGTPTQANGHAQHIQAATTTPASGAQPAHTPTSAGSSTTASGRKKGVKSEKRSASMTQWWAERKARQAADRQAEQQRQAAAAEAQNAAAAAHNPQGYGVPVNGYKGPYPPTQAQPPFQSYSTQPAVQPSNFRAIAPGPHQGQGAQAQAQTHHHHHIPQATHHHHTPPAPLHPPTQAGQPPKQPGHGPFGYDGAGSPPPPIHGSLHQGQSQEGVPDSVRRDILGLRGRPEPRRGL